MRFNLNIETPSYKNLETVVTEFEKINADYQKLKQESCEKFRVAFEDFVKDFFKLVPSVKRVVWTQYTPYFADGDTCVFSVNEPTFYNFLSEEEDFDEDHDEKEVSQQWELDSWSLRKFADYGLTEEELRVLQFLTDIITNNDDFMLELYEDHTEVTLTAEGIETDYCEHD